jgi:hypothetical protein
MPLELFQGLFLWHKSRKYGVEKLASRKREETFLLSNFTTF